MFNSDIMRNRNYTANPILTKRNSFDTWVDNSKITCSGWYNYCLVKPCISRLKLPSYRSMYNIM